jgi:hypothetical protein
VVRPKLLSVIVSVEDLFVAGLGFDIAGAYLVSRGLLAPGPKIAQKATTYWGGSPHTMVAAAEDRVAGVFGLCSLVFGFALQGTAYFLVIAGASIGDHGIAQATVAATLAWLPVMLVLVSERLARPELARRTVVEAAKWDPNARKTRALPKGDLLYLIGLQAWGITRIEGEDDAAYAKRVWKVDRIAPPGMFDA